MSSLIPIPKVCPIMSRAVTHPKSEYDPDEGYVQSDREDYLIEIDCLEEKCALYVENEGYCSLKVQALMLDGIYSRGVGVENE